MKRIYLYIAIALLFVQCRGLGYDGGRYIDFYNHSNNPISYIMNFEKGIFYPDTTLPLKDPKPFLINKECHVSLPFSENDLFGKVLPTDTLSIFFFDPDILAKYDWDAIQKDYKILKRYDLSKDDLQKLNWKIVYPPTEAMKNMKMYSPYSK